MLPDDEPDELLEGDEPEELPEGDDPEELPRPVPEAPASEGGAVVPVAPPDEPAVALDRGPDVAEDGDAPESVLDRGSGLELSPESTVSGDPADPHAATNVERAAATRLEQTRMKRSILSVSVDLCHGCRCWSCHARIVRRRWKSCRTPTASG
jgi:hypothetical protein